MVNTHAGGFRGQQTAEGEGHTPGTSGQEGQTGLVCRRLGKHVGVALQQEMSPGSLQPLGFFSRKLNTAEQKYSAFDRELLMVYVAIRHFRWALEGRWFYVLSDHKPLTFALHRQSDA